MCKWAKKAGIEFQSTPPCGGRLVNSHGADDMDVVSIHAPVRGATKGFAFVFSLILVSIHAPVRGATFFILVRVLMF